LATVDAKSTLGKNFDAGWGCRNVVENRSYAVVVPHVLVVEDDQVIADEVRRALDAQGYDIEVAHSGHSALRRARATPPDLVVLDLGLPDLDGVQVCRQLRAELAGTPIVIVTARDADIDVVVGLDAGATDYVVKPFAMAVLLARLRAHLRRWSATSDGEIVVGALRIDAAAHRAFVGETEIELRPKEFALLVALTEEAGRVVTRDRLLQDVWDLQWDTSTKTLDMHVHALRRKLGTRPDADAWITTVRSVGYRFETG
jgi:DNA-binding response OmpR family regulator